jgi:myo-inositol-1(or 4)-monophosphatase
MVQKAFPDHHILSEEEPASLSESGIIWIIDPLDGTTNFIHGIPIVAVSLAVCIEGETLFGLVYDPFRKEQFVARKGQGAFLNGRPLKVREGFPLSEALVATGFPFRAKHLIDPYMATFKRIFQEVSDIRRAGSAALDLAYLAAGRLDGFWEIGLGPWDVAAGGLLIEEAGGKVSDFWEKPQFIQNGHIVAGTPSVYPFLLEEVNRSLAPVLDPNALPL